MVRRYLTEDESVQEIFEYRPRYGIGGIRLIKSPFRLYKYYLTDKRVIFETNTTIGDKTVKDVPLNEIISIYHNKDNKKILLLLGLSLFLLPFILQVVLPSMVLFTLSDFFPVVRIIGILILIYAILKRRNEFRLQTSNPDVSISLPPARTTESENFLQSIRQNTEDLNTRAGSRDDVH